MYTLFGTQGSGSAAIEIALQVDAEPVVNAVIRRHWP
ncbi:hypothetical protein PSYPI_09055 [Pseudomonas syringae pv. pisi str. 1704B]|uniref:Uncharacterized protein n=1 Tax=Pseudomonas syringae pv. pisi str. 1704B TaxID=629263 RepID=F3G640_PSESJ|nr:hypothetical protein PSYPI_09055 [Pseudomonas syringae pv. pisi str. 1704B]